MDLQFFNRKQRRRLKIDSLKGTGHRSGQQIKFSDKSTYVVDENGSWVRLYPVKKKKKGE